MQHKARATGGGFAQALVQIHPVPTRNQFRLALRQASPHRKFRLREKQGLGIIALFGSVGHGVRYSVGKDAVKMDENPNKPFRARKLRD